jgi:succinoglycan biosynthesis transport protein ExoP
MDSNKMDRSPLQSPRAAIAPMNGAYSLSAETVGAGGRFGQPESGGLVEYHRILRRYKGTVILIAFLGFVAGIFLTLAQTPIYQARILLEIQDLNDNFMNMKQVSPLSEGGGWGGQSDIQTQIKILQSETLVKRVIAKVNNGSAENINATGRILAWRKALNLPAPAPKAMGAAPDLKVRVVGQTRIIEALCDSTNPSFAADFLNTLAQQYIDSNMEARWNTSQRTGEWLTRQLEEMRRKLERSEDDLQAYARRSGLIFTGEKTNVSDDKLKQLQEELSRAQADRIMKQSRYEMTKAGTPDALLDILNDSSLRALQDKVTELRRQQAELITIYTEKHDRVRRVEAQIGPLEAALQKERTGIVDRMRNEYDAALRREQILATEYATQSRLVSDQAEKSIQYNILKREADSNRQLYEAMLQRVKETSIASAMHASNVRVVDAAEPPTVPYKPDIKINAALALFAGLFLAVGFVVMRDRVDRSLQGPGDARFWLNIHELGVIPSAGNEKRVSTYHPRNTKYKEPSPAILPLIPPVPAIPTALLSSASPTPVSNGSPGSARTFACDSVELIASNRKRSLIADSFRATLTSILFSGENGNRPRILVLTSAGPSEGKTTVTSNLGIVLAELRRKVLIIDADLRKPRMHKVFGVPNERGLSSLLGDQQPLPHNALDGLVQQTAIEGLFVLPSGPVSQAATNLLYSGALSERLAQFKKEFDTVVIDTPPMLHIPDARVVGRVSDAVILVTKANHTTRDTVLAALQLFSEDNTRVLGTILNDWNPKLAPGAYYGYGDRSYHNDLKKYYAVIDHK